MPSSALLHPPRPWTAFDPIPDTCHAQSWFDDDDDDDDDEADGVWAETVHAIQEAERPVELAEGEAEVGIAASAPPKEAAPCPKTKLAPAFRRIAMRDALPCDSADRSTDAMRRAQTHGMSMLMSFGEACFYVYERV